MKRKLSLDDPSPLTRTDIGLQLISDLCSLVLRTIKAILGACDDTTPFIRDCSIMDSLIVQSSASFGSSLSTLQSETML